MESSKFKQDLARILEQFYKEELAKRTKRGLKKCKQSRKHKRYK